MQNYIVNYRYNNMDCSLTVSAANRIAAILEFSDILEDSGIEISDAEFISMVMIEEEN